MGMDNGVQEYEAHGQWGTVGNGVEGYRPHGQWGTAGNQVQGLGAHGQWGTGQVMCQNVKKMSSCQKDVKCQKNQTPRLWRRFTKKIN